MTFCYCNRKQLALTLLPIAIVMEGKIDSRDLNWVKNQYTVRKTPLIPGPKDNFSSVYPPPPITLTLFRFT